MIALFDTGAAGPARRDVNPGSASRLDRLPFGSRLVVLLPVLALSHIGAVAAQPAETAAPLPKVVYPFRIVEVPPPDAGPRTATPQPDEAAEDQWPVQYVFLDGAWGYRDQNQRIRPMPPSVAGRTVNRRSRAIPIGTNTGLRATALPRVEAHGR